MITYQSNKSHKVKNKTSARKSSEMTKKGNNTPRSARKSSECYRPPRPMSRQEQMSPKERYEKRLEYLTLIKELKISTTGRKHRDWLEHLEELKKSKSISQIVPVSYRVSHVNLYGLSYLSVLLLLVLFGPF